MKIKMLVLCVALGGCHHPITAKDIEKAHGYCVNNGGIEYISVGFILLYSHTYCNNKAHFEIRSDQN